ncbi:MAG: flotillin family protein [Deltaproteobacteria bacterium]|nr:flotillin family protein [Deltaproteobacteria bacterium]
MLAMPISVGTPLLASAAQYAEAAEDGAEGLFGMLGAGALVVLAFLIVVLIVKKFLFICGPHEILVFSGRKHRLRDGSVSNYEIKHGGRGLRKPFLETVRRMDMRLFPVQLVVHNAYSAGNIPLTVHAIANVKIANDPIGVRNAVERFLNYPPAQIAQAAQDQLGGVLREVVSKLTPEEVNEDRLKFAGTLVDHARDDLQKLGLALDVLKIQHVSDDQDYLSNLGRPRIARMLRDADNAENAANQKVAEAQAAARQRAQTTAKKMETDVVQAKNNVRARLAEFEAKAKQVENQAEIAVETARAKAEQRLQELRAEAEQLRLHCDVVLPAEAQRKAQELKARGEAAPAVENGKAAASALRAVAQQWAKAGESGRQIYLLQQLRELASAAVQRASGASVDTIKVVAGDEAALGTVLASHPAAVSRVLRETALALGLDLGPILGPKGADAVGRP